MTHTDSKLRTKATAALGCLLDLAILAFAVIVCAGVMSLSGGAMAGLSLVMIRILSGQPMVGAADLSQGQPWETWFVVAGVVASVACGEAKMFQDREVRGVVSHLKLCARVLLGLRAPSST